MNCKDKKHSWHFAEIGIGKTINIVFAEPTEISLITNEFLVCWNLKPKELNSISSMLQQSGLM